MHLFDMQLLTLDNIQCKKKIFDSVVDTTNAAFCYTKRAKNYGAFYESNYSKCTRTISLEFSKIVAHYICIILESHFLFICYEVAVNLFFFEIPATLIFLSIMLYYPCFGYEKLF